MKQRDKYAVHRIAIIDEGGRTVDSNEYNLRIDAWRRGENDLGDLCSGYYEIW